MNTHKNKWGVKAVTLVMGIITTCGLVPEVVADYCDTLGDPTVVFCDDFSGSNPLAAYLVENPPSPSGGQSPRSISINGGELSSAYVIGFGVTKISSLTALPVRNHSLEGLVRFSTASSVRSSAGINWLDGVSSNLRQIQFWLQDDENAAYLEIDQRGPSLTGTYRREGVSYPVLNNTTYQLRLDITPDTGGNHRLRCYVNGVLVMDVTDALSLLPALMRPGFAGNSHGTVDLRYDNLVVRALDQPPVADAGSNLQIASSAQSVTVIGGTASDPDNDPIQYRWLEGSTELLGWTAVGAGGVAPLALGGLPYFSIGNHTLTLEVKDAQLTVSDDMVLTIENSPPEAWPAPSSQTVEIGLDPIEVVADVSDFDGDVLAWEWSHGATSLASGLAATTQGGDRVALPKLCVPAGDAAFGVGTHELVLSVSDGVNNAVVASVEVVVTDTAAPTLSPIPSVTILWPPNHQLQPVVIQANACDNGGGAIHLEVTVLSSEPANGTGDGNTEVDSYVDSVDDATGLIQLRLRSERAGGGSGRTYTVVITATDESGNQSTARVDIRAPHDKRKQ